MTEFPYTGERAVPWNPATGGHILAQHAARYAWAMRFCEGKRVVDLGSGCGYGSFMLSWVAAAVLGVEIDAGACAFAREWFKATNLRFVQGDVMERLPDGEVYVAFEVLEHLEDPVRLADRIKGTLLWSVPIHDDSRFHKRVYSPTRAAYEFGGSCWWQSALGYIVPESGAKFVPHNVLGVRP